MNAATDVKKPKAIFGSDILPYIPKISQLRITNFKEFPYLYSGSLECESKYMKGYSQEPRSLLIAVEDENNELIAVSTGMPLASNSEVVEGACSTFQKAGYDTSEMFYFGETIIVSRERGKGLYSKIVKFREEVVKEMGFSKGCFMAVIRPKDHPLRPKDYQEIDQIFSHMDYEKTPIVISHRYPTFLPDGTVKDMENPMSYWTKTLIS